jgi:hypothetical protein
MTVTTTRVFDPEGVATTEKRPRPSVTARRFGYALSIAINVILIYLINEWPGWQSLTFLTPDAASLIPLVNAVLVITLIANAIYLIVDPRWLRALGDAVTGAASLILLLVLLSTFPFDFSPFSFDWTMLLQIMLVLGIVVTTVSIIANLVTFIRELGRT